jgi:hypothetical protein
MLMDPGARNWLLGFARKTFWRLCQPGYEFQDLVQEGFLCWQKVVDRYPDAVDQARVMALFKNTFRITFWTWPGTTANASVFPRRGRGQGGASHL